MFLNQLYTETAEVYSAQEALPLILCEFEKASTARTNYKKPYYIDIGATFDIETTVVKNQGSPHRDSGKYSHFNYCFCWQACIAGILIFGRYVNEWFDLCNELSAALGKVRLIVYVHNLAFEYNNLTEYFVANAEKPERDLFFRDRIHPLYILNGNIEYRCSYQLTHKRLAQLSKEIGLEKSGDLDYTKDRHSGTPMYEAEIEYCLRDVYNLYKWIEAECGHYSKSIHKKRHYCYMPLTQTGYVRYDIKHDFSNTKKGSFYNKDNILTEEQYNICHAAFRGGDTHAAYYHLCKTFENVRHRDFTSAYPAKMALERFPAKGFKDFPNASVTDLCDLIASDFAVIATYDLRAVRLKPKMTSFIACSSCHYISNDSICENGRVMCAEQVILTTTEIDLATMFQVYDFTIESVDNVIYARKAPLPDDLIKVVLRYFQGKTVFKDVAGMENEYRLSKEKLNACYGCAATALIRPKIFVNVDDLETMQECAEYKPGRVLPYAIGVYITAYLRRDLNYFKCLLRDDFLYCDTDSIFYIENPEFEKAVEQYNQANRKRLAALARRLGDIDLVMPKNPDGKRQYLGEFMADKDYIIDKFITCGAKRYVTQRNGVIDMTFSGVGDTKSYKDDNGVIHTGKNVVYLQDHYKADIFTLLERFPEQPLYIPYTEETGKLTHYVERGEFIGVIDDGSTKQTVTAKSSMVLVPVDLTLTLEPSLMELLIYDKMVWTMY